MCSDFTWMISFNPLSHSMRLYFTDEESQAWRDDVTYSRSLSQKCSQGLDPGSLTPELFVFNHDIEVYMSSQVYGRIRNLSGQRVRAPGASCLSVFFLLSHLYGRLQWGRKLEEKLISTWNMRGHLFVLNLAQAMLWFPWWAVFYDQ